MKKQMKRNHGITLIALVVTIIVLLILAAISIGVLTGDNGIIKQSQQAKEETEIAEEKEVLNLSIAQATGEDVYGNLEEEPFREKLNDNAEGTELEKIGDNYKVTFPSDREYIVTGNGDINPIDYANTVELVAKLAYIDGKYVIGVGFKDFQIKSDFMMNYINLMKELLTYFINQNNEEKEAIFVQYMNEMYKTSFTEIQDTFDYLYTQGYIEKPVTSLEEYFDITLTEETKEEYENQIKTINGLLDMNLTIYDACFLEIQFSIFEKEENSEILEELQEKVENMSITGTIKAPNGDSFKLSTDNINSNNDLFGSYCYQYPITQNGSYTFTFVGDDGSYGETTLQVDDGYPQLVTHGYYGYGFDSNCIVLMEGLGNFVNIEEASLDSFVDENGLSSDKTTINLTSNIIFRNLPELSSQNIAVLFVEDDFQGELTCKYDGKEFKRKVQFIGPR